MARRRPDSDKPKKGLTTPTDYVDEERGCLHDLKLMGYVIAGFLLFGFVGNQIACAPKELSQWEGGQLKDSKYQSPKLPSEAEGISLF